MEYPEELISTAVDKLVKNIITECFPYDYVASTSELQDKMKKVIGENLVVFLEETLVRA